MNLNNALWLTNVVAEAAVVGLLLYRRAWRLFPVFCLYCAWDLFSNSSNYLIIRFFHDRYISAYLIETTVDSALELGILVELSWSVLRPLRAQLRRRALILVVCLVVLAAICIWPITGIHEMARLGLEMRILVRAQQTASILRVLFFLLLAGCSQLLSIGWRDRELQVATGLGFYSFISLTATMLQTHQSMGQHYFLLNQLVIASYFCSLFYWAICFAHQEPERKPFSPQMQNFLLALAGHARSERLTLVDRVVNESTKRP
jgi:hypothetical protein